MDRGLREQSFACTASDRLIRLRSRDVSSTASKNFTNIGHSFLVCIFRSEAPLFDTTSIGAMPRMGRGDFIDMSFLALLLSVAIFSRLHKLCGCQESYGFREAGLRSQNSGKDFRQEMRGFHHPLDLDFREEVQLYS